MVIAFWTSLIWYGNIICGTFSVVWVCDDGSVWGRFRGLVSCLLCIFLEYCDIRNLDDTGVTAGNGIYDFSQSLCFDRKWWYVSMSECTRATCLLATDSFSTLLHPQCDRQIDTATSSLCCSRVTLWCLICCVVDRVIVDWWNGFVVGFQTESTLVNPLESAKEAHKTLVYNQSHLLLKLLNTAELWLWSLNQSNISEGNRGIIPTQVLTLNSLHRLVWGGYIDIVLFGICLSSCSD